MKSVSFKKSVCIVLSTLITLAFLLSNAAGILPGHNIVRAAGDGHSHIGALDESKDDHAGWTAWDNDSSLPTDPGSYYLTTDVTLTSGAWVVPAGTTNLCLNGRSITVKHNEDTSQYGSAGIVVGSGATLNLYDESGNGGKITQADGYSSGSVVVFGGICNMFGGTISGINNGGVDVTDNGTFNMEGGAIQGNGKTNSSTYGGGVHIADGGTFNMSGGTISGNFAFQGGGVYVMDNGTFNMSGGTISGNKASGDSWSSGGGVFVYSNGTFNMSGGTISGNTASASQMSAAGGGVYVIGTFNMTDGIISGNTAEDGDGVTLDKVGYNSNRGYLNGAGVFNMSGGTITNNSVDIYLGDDNGTFNPSGTAKIDGYSSVSFEANGGSGSMTKQYTKTNEKLILSQNEFTCEGHNFTGWNTKADGRGDPYSDEQEISSLTEDLTLYAQWTPIKYTIKFVDEDGTELSSEKYDYGTAAADIVKPADPTKAPTAQNTYTFEGWSPDVADVTGDATYKATYSSSINEYTIKFVDDTGKELSSAKYDYGTKAADIVTPDTAKAATAQYTYEFKNWDKVITDVIADATYTSVYTTTVNKYTIKFVNEDGTVVSSKQYDYGTKAADITKPADPTKTGTTQYTYTFDGWTPEIKDVTGDATYTAKFSSTVNKYTVKFVNEDGTVLQSSEVAYGETPAYTGKTPVKADTEDYTYTFSGWTPEIAKVTGDATYKAVFTEKQKVGTYYLKNIEGDGKGGDIIAIFGRTENDENAINYLDKVKADGKVLTRDKDYTAKKGSVIITIKKAYLDTLSEGTHTLEVCFTDGASVTLDFTVKHQAKYHVGTNTNANAATSTNTNTNTNTKAQASVPATGEKVAKTVFIGAGCVILACALAGGVFAMKIKRKEEA